jgi:YD repeat-containing protein
MSGRLWVMTNRDRSGLRGSVKRCELHRTWYSRGCGPERCETEERSDISAVEFRRDGFVQCRWYKNPAPNSTEWTNLYDYNDANQLTAVRIEQGGTIRIQQAFEYDLAGRVSRIIVHDEDGGQRIAETYSCEPDGRKTKITHLHPKLSSERCGTMFGVDGTDVSYAAPGATSITSVYDAGGRLIEHLFHGSGGKLVARVELRYDERGNLVEEVYRQQTLELPPEMMVQFSPEQLEAVRMLFTFREHHRYDSRIGELKHRQTRLQKIMIKKPSCTTSMVMSFHKFRSRLAVNTILKKTGDLCQSRTALARIGRRRSFGINMIRSATGSRRSLKIQAGRSGVSNVERSVTFDEETGNAACARRTNAE